MNENIADQLINFIQEHREEINKLGWGRIIVEVFRYKIDKIDVGKTYKPA